MVRRVDLDRLVGHAELGRHGDRVVDVLVLSRRRRDEEQPAFLEPDVFAERAHRADRAVRGARRLECPLGPERLVEPPKRRPVAVQKAAVACARPGAARLRFEDDRRDAPLLQRPRRPEPRQTAADHRDVRVDRPVQGRRDLVGRRFEHPPGRRRASYGSVQAKLLHAAARSR